MKNSPTKQNTKVVSPKKVPPKVQRLSRPNMIETKTEEENNISFD